MHKEGGAEMKRRDFLRLSAFAAGAHAILRAGGEEKAAAFRHIDAEVELC